MLIVHDPRCAAYGSSERPEQPARVLTTVPVLKARHPAWTWREPDLAAAGDDVLLLAHTPAHLRRLAEPRDFDADTPFFPNIAVHARRAVAGALLAARHAFDTQSPAFSLMRPPGHHATAEAAMGFCYLNSAAIAAIVAQARWGAARVAVWDFDAHHGNGTEDLFAGRTGLLYVSVHQYPGYPGTGTRDTGAARNWPVPPGASRDEHRRALGASWDAVTGFRPDLIIVSAGFDAYVGDPITELPMEKADFGEVGGWLAQSHAPVAALLEGGYSADLPELVDAFLTAWAGPEV